MYSSHLEQDATSLVLPVYASTAPCLIELCAEYVIVGYRHVLNVVVMHMQCTSDVQNAVRMQQAGYSLDMGMIIGTWYCTRTDGG